MDPRFIGLGGGLAILLIALIFSNKRSAINLRIVCSALLLQIAIGFFVLKTPIGKTVILRISEGVNTVIGYSNAGISMVFGKLASDANLGVIFAVHVLPILIFFSALIAVLYHLRIMQLIVAGVGSALHFLIGARPVESLNSAATIFVGQTESPLVIKPYLDRLTEPQVFAIMVAGMASVAGTVLAAYALLGIDIGFLLAASFMAAPGGLLMAKLIMPDEKGPQGDRLQVSAILAERSHADNVIMAAGIGAQDGMKLAFNIGAMLIAFVGLIALLNGIMGGLGGLFGHPDLSMQQVLGWAFSPLMALVGVPWAEAQQAGAIFGQKLILNEFVAYADLGQIQSSLSARTVTILTFALCGFANFSSIAIQMGALGALAPQLMPIIAKFGLRAVLAGSLSNLMSATIAGLLLAL